MSGKGVGESQGLGGAAPGSRRPGKSAAACRQGGPEVATVARGAGSCALCHLLQPSPALSPRPLGAGVPQRHPPALQHVPRPLGEGVERGGELLRGDAVSVYVCAWGGCVCAFAGDPCSVPLQLRAPGRGGRVGRSEQGVLRDGGRPGRHRARVEDPRGVPARLLRPPVRLRGQRRARRRARPWRGEHAPHCSFLRGSIDNIQLINEEHMVSGADDG